MKKETIYDLWTEDDFGELTLADLHEALNEANSHICCVLRWIEIEESRRRSKARGASSSRADRRTTPPARRRPASSTRAASVANRRAR